MNPGHEVSAAMLPAKNAEPTAYDAVFYAEQADGSLRSARVVVPLVMNLVKPTSVVDVGCGVGTWLAAFAEAGVGDILGIDGDYVDRTKLRIPVDRFLAADLTAPPHIGRTFNLSVCLEVAEHLPEKFANQLVEYLTTAAPIVLFSAALPGQGGTNHLNERWPHYWQRLFEMRGYVRLDPFRPVLWRDPRVEWWYKQNIYLYVKQDVLSHHGVLTDEYKLSSQFTFELISQHVLAQCTSISTLRGALAALPMLAVKAIRRLWVG